MNARVVTATVLVIAVVGLASAQSGTSSSGVAASRAALPAISPTNEDLQPLQLPPLPTGLTVADLVEGDRIFHSTGGCFACHGADGEGLPAAGAAITTGLAYVQLDVPSIAKLITDGLPDAYTRSPIAMPPRGARGTLSPREIELVADYVWAIAQVRGEPWPGGHASHFHLIPAGSTSGTASPDRPSPRHQ